MPPPWRVNESPEYLADLEQIGGPGYDWAERREGIRFLLRQGATRLGYYAVEEGEVTLIRARGYSMPADNEDEY